MLDNGFEYIPLQNHSPTPEDVLAIADRSGGESQISIPGTEHEQLNMLWYLLSNIALRAQKTVSR